MVTKCRKAEKEGGPSGKMSLRQEKEGWENGSSSRPTGQVRDYSALTAIQEVYLQGSNHFWREYPPLYTNNCVGETANQRAFQEWEQGSLLNSQGHLLLPSQALLLPCFTDPLWLDRDRSPQGRRDTCFQRKKIFLFLLCFQVLKPIRTWIQFVHQLGNHQRWLNGRKRDEKD